MVGPKKNLVRILGRQPRGFRAGDSSLETQTRRAPTGRSRTASAAGRRTRPGAVPEKAGEKPRIRLKQRRHSMDESGLPTPSTDKPACPVRARPECGQDAPAIRAYESASNQLGRSPRVFASTGPGSGTQSRTETCMPDQVEVRHISHSNAWSARKRTMVRPRGLTASSLFFTLSRKT